MAVSQTTETEARTSFIIFSSIVVHVYCIRMKISQIRELGQTSFCTRFSFSADAKTTRDWAKLVYTYSLIWSKKSYALPQQHQHQQQEKLHTPGSAHSPVSLRLIDTNWSTGLSDARCTTLTPVLSLFHLHSKLRQSRLTNGVYTDKTK